MKTILSVVLLISILHCEAQSKNVRAIHSVLQDQTRAWNDGDLENFMVGYWENDSLMFIGKSGITYGWKNTLDNYKKGYPDTASMGKLHFTLLHIKKLSNKYYQVIGKWNLSRSIGDVNGHFSLLFRKIRGSWVIVADHSS